MSLRLVSYNIRYGGAGREKALAAMIAGCDADVVVLQEATRPDVVQRLAAECGMALWGAQPGHSLAWLSRLEGTQATWLRPWMAKRSYLKLTAGGVRIYGLHLAAIHSNLTEARRVWEARALLRGVAGEAFHVLTGDFNSVAPGDSFDLGLLPGRLRAFSWATGGRVRWRTLRLLLRAGYVDGYRLVHEDPGYTFPAWRPHVRLDYCLIPAGSESRLESCDVANGATASEASDHLPLLSVIKGERD